MAEKTEDKKNKSHKKKKTDYTKKMRENPWIISTIVLAVLALLVFAGNLGSCVTGQTISEEEAGERLVNHLNDEVPQGEVTLKSVEEDKGLYKTVVTYQGRDVPIYVTKNGDTMFQGAQDISTQDSQDSEETSKDMKEFNECLAEKGVVVYGMESCPYCQDLVESLGGYEAAEPVYVECTEEQQRCQEEMIGTGVPEIQINGEKYGGERTAEALSQETGCEIKENQETESSSEETTQSSEEVDKEISEFMECLNQNNVKIYGAEWCGYTQQLVETMGGQEAVSPIYVECTEEKQLCSEEGVEGYPTIKIDGEKVNIERSFEGFAEATGCSAPEVETSSSSNNDASC